MLDVALKLGLDILEDGLDRVAVGIAHRALHCHFCALLAHHLLAVHEGEAFDLTALPLKDVCEKEVVMIEPGTRTIVEVIQCITPHYQVFITLKSSCIQLISRGYQFPNHADFVLST